MRRRAGRRWLSAAGMLLLLLRGTAAAAEVLDDFETLTDWTATVSDPGVKVELSDPGRPAGDARSTWASRPAAAAPGPQAVRTRPRTTIHLRSRASAPRSTSQAIDSSEKNVWWYA
jgi:hypothetical protein